MKDRLDDLEAVRQIAEILDKFDPKDRERIVRWVREKLGMERPEPRPLGTDRSPLALLLYQLLRLISDLSSAPRTLRAIPTWLRP